jgi:hypothetical protein
MAERLTVAEWAATRGMSRQAGYVAVKRCSIPIDPDGRLDRRVADLLYQERTRYRYKPPKPAPRRAEPIDLVELATDIAVIMEDDPHLIPEGMPHLVAVLARMEEDMLAQVLLPPAVHAALELHLAEPEALPTPGATS